MYDKIVSMTNSFLQKCFAKKTLFSQDASKASKEQNTQEKQTYQKGNKKERIPRKTTYFISRKNCKGCCKDCNISFCPEKDEFYWCSHCINLQCVNNRRFSMDCTSDCQNCKHTQCIEHHLYNSREGPLKNC